MFGELYYNTDSESTDESKRKRSGEDEVESDIINKKSKRTIRTPKKDRGSKEKRSDMDEIRSMMKDLLKEQQKSGTETGETKKIMMELIKEVKEIRSENKEVWEHFQMMKQENDSLKQEIKDIKEKMSKMEQTAKEMDLLLERNEREKKKNNLLIRGVEIDSKNREIISGAMENMIKQYMDVEVKIKNAYKINDRTCLIEIDNFNQKLEVLKNKHKLKNVKSQIIYIENDLTTKERDIQKTIRAVANTEKRKGKSVKISFNKLVIEGVEWVWNTRKGKLEKNENNTATKNA